MKDLLKPENKEKLVSILTYHVIPGKVMAKDVMSMSNPSMPTTVNGKQLTVKTTSPVMFNNANLEKADIEASNGVIHVIDTVPNAGIIFPVFLTNTVSGRGFSPCPLLLFHKGVEMIIENKYERSGAITFKGTPMTLAGRELNVGDIAPDIPLIGAGMSDVSAIGYRLNRQQGAIFCGDTQRGYIGLLDGIQTLLR